MKTPNKQELPKTALNCSRDIDVQDSMNLYRRCTTKPYSFLAIDTTLASDNLLERVKKLIMIVDDKIKDEEL